MDLELLFSLSGVSLIPCKLSFPPILDNVENKTNFKARVTTYLYWLVGTFSNDLNETSFLTAIINSTGSVGSTFGFVVSALDVSYNWACAVNLILFFISVPPLAWVVFAKVTNSTHGTNLSSVSTFTGSESEDRDVSVEYKQDAKVAAREPDL